MSNNDTFTECEVLHFKDHKAIFAVTVTYSTETGEIVSTDYEGVFNH